MKKLTIIASSILLMLFTLSSMAQDTTKTEGPTRFILILKGDTTVFDIPGKNSKPESNTKEEEEKQPKKKKVKETSAFFFDLGVNGLLYNGSFKTPSAFNALDLDYSKSRGVNLAKVYSQNLIGEVLRVQYGLGLESNNYRFRNNVYLKTLKDSLAFAEYADGSTMKKAKLNPNYLYVPLMLEIRTRPYKYKKSFNIACGIEGSYLLNQKFKRVYNDAEGNSNKVKSREDFHLAPFKYSAVGRIGYGNLNFFVRYGLSDMFESGIMPEVRPVMAAITLSGF